MAITRAFVDREPNPHAYLVRDAPCRKSENRIAKELTDLAKSKWPISGWALLLRNQDSRYFPRASSFLNFSTSR